MADYLSRMDFIVLDELGYLPVRPIRRAAPVPPHQPALRAEPPIIVTTNLAFGEWPNVFAGRRQDDDRAPRPPHPPLRDRRDRQRELALQEPSLTPHQQAGATITPSEQPRSPRPGWIGAQTVVRDKGVNIGRRSGVNVRRRLTFKKARVAVARSLPSSSTPCGRRTPSSVGARPPHDADHQH